MQFTYKLNKMGDNKPPCLTPLNTLSFEESQPFHLTTTDSFEYQLTMTLTKTPRKTLED
jgi:hypothetical protein